MQDRSGLVQNDEWKSNGYLWIVFGLVLTNIFWGAASVGVKEALKQLEIIEIVAYRFSAAAVILLVITLLWKGRSALKVERKDVPFLALLAFLGIPLEFLLQVLALDNTTATDFTLITCTIPFFIIFASAVIYRTGYTRSKLLGAVLASFGVVLVVAGGGASMSADLMGDGLALASCVVWAFYTVLGKPINQRYSTLTVLNYTFIFGALEMLPLLLFTTPTMPSSFTGTTWASMLFLTLCCSLGAFFMFNYAIEKLPVSTVGTFTYVEPLAGVLTAVVVLGESMTWATVAGMALIILGIYTAEQLGMHRRRTPADA